MRIGILQPGYLPWLGFFEQLYRSDVFVIYDDVQYDKHGWRNRNRIKTQRGAQWLTVPVEMKFEEHPVIREVRIDNRRNWRKKHLESIRQNYSKAGFFEEYISLFEKAYALEWEYLVDLDMHFIEEISVLLGLDTGKIHQSSKLGVSGGRTERLIKICHKLGTDTFYEGSAGRNYIDEEEFAAAGIKVEYQNYNHPVYDQLYGEFVSHLSVIDLLFNHGGDSLPILINEKNGVR